MKKAFLLSLLVLATTMTALQASQFNVVSGKYHVRIGVSGLPIRMTYDGVDICRGASFTVQLPTTDGTAGIRFVVPNSQLDPTTSITVTKDGVVSEKLMDTFEGQEIKVVRVSQCENLQITYTTVVTPDNITISSKYVAVGPQGLKGLYAISIHWDCKSVDWLAKMQNESFSSGKFESNNGFFLHRTNQRTLWYAIFFPESKLGIVTVLDDDTAMAGGCRFWDRALPNHHQMIYQPSLPQQLEAGFETIEHKMTITAFPATAETLQAEAEKIAEPEEEE